MLVVLLMMYVCMYELGPGFSVRVVCLTRVVWFLADALNAT
jgi:hypothetical protein